MSVYNLFVVSIFWQMNVDLFSPEQGKRLFGFIAAGATLGAIVGSARDRDAGALVPPMVLLIGAAVLLEVAVFASAGCRACRRRCGTAAGAGAGRERPIGGSVFAGITQRAPLALSAQCQPVHPAVRDQLDLSLFPAGRDRQPQL